MYFLCPSAFRHPFVRSRIPNGGSAKGLREDKKSSQEKVDNIEFIDTTKALSRMVLLIINDLRKLDPENQPVLATKLRNTG